MMKTAQELMHELGEKSKERRLSLNLTRDGLGSRSGVSISVIRQFEMTGKISLESFLKIAIALGVGGEFEQLFKGSELQQSISMDQLLKQSKVRKRGRIS
jgi:transcriptional regulator with XRE-family HTH domain